jgi:hypothetical protein
LNKAHLLKKLEITIEKNLLQEMEEMKGGFFSLNARDFHDSEKKQNITSQHHTS